MEYQLAEVCKGRRTYANQFCQRAQASREVVRRSVVNSLEAVTHQTNEPVLIVYIISTLMIRSVLHQLGFREYSSLQ